MKARKYVTDNGKKVVLAVLPEQQQAAGQVEPSNFEEDGELEVSEHSTEEEEEGGGQREWKVYAHAANTHNPEALWYLQHDQWIMWRAIDLSHISPSARHQELWVPKFNNLKLAARFKSAKEWLILTVQSFVTRSHEDEEVKEKKQFKDLNLETCTSAEIREMFQDKAFLKDAVTMLRLYVDIGTDVRFAPCA